MKAELQELRQSASPQKPRSGFAPVDALTGQDEQDKAPWGLVAKTGQSPIPPGAAERSHARDDDEEEGAGEAGQRAGGARASPAFSLEAPLEAWGADDVDRHAVLQRLRARQSRSMPGEGGVGPPATPLIERMSAKLERERLRGNVDARVGPRERLGEGGVAKGDRGRSGRPGTEVLRGYRQGGKETGSGDGMSNDVLGVEGHGTLQAVQAVQVAGQRHDHRAEDDEQHQDRQHAQRRRGISAEPSPQPKGFSAKVADIVAGLDGLVSTVRMSHQARVLHALPDDLLLRAAACADPAVPPVALSSASSPRSLSAPAAARIPRAESASDSATESPRIGGAVASGAEYDGVESENDAAVACGGGTGFLAQSRQLTQSPGLDARETRSVDVPDDDDNQEPCSHSPVPNACSCLCSVQLCVYCTVYLCMAAHTHSLNHTHPHAHCLSVKTHTQTHTHILPTSPQGSPASSSVRSPCKGLGKKGGFGISKRKTTMASAEDDAREKASQALFSLALPTQVFSALPPTPTPLCKYLHRIIHASVARWMDV